MKDDRRHVFASRPSVREIQDCVVSLSVCPLEHLIGRDALRPTEVFPVDGTEAAVRELLRDVDMQIRIAERAPSILQNAYGDKDGCYWEAVFEEIVEGRGPGLLTLNLAVSIASGGRILFPTHIARISETDSNYGKW